MKKKEYYSENMKPKYKINGKEKIALGLFLVSIIGTALSFSGNSKLEANIFYPEKEKITVAQVVKKIISAPVFPAEKFKNAIAEQNTKEMQKYIKEIKESEKFMEDFSAWIMVDEVKIQHTKNGFFLSLIAAKNSIIQPYFGFFNTQEKKIIWGEHSSAKVLNIQKEENDFIQILVKNTGEYPWITKNNWKNRGSNAAVKMLSTKQEILPKDTVSLLVQEEDIFLLMNSDFGFDVIFQ